VSKPGPTYSKKDTELIQAAAARLPSLQFKKRSGLVGGPVQPSPMGESPDEQASIPGSDSSNSTSASIDPTPPGFDSLRSQRIALKDLVESPHQPRLSYDEDDLLQLGKSIKQRQVEPILVRPASHLPGRYEIISGHRRTRAAQLVGLDSLDALIITASDAEAQILVLAANEPREEFSDYERALAYQAILGNEDSPIRSQVMLSEWIGVSPSLISKRLRILDLPTEVLEVLRKYPRAMSHKWVADIIELASRPTYDPEIMRSLLLRVGAQEINISSIFSSFPLQSRESRPSVSNGLSLQRGNQLFASVTPHPTKRQVTVKIPGDAPIDEVAQIIHSALTQRYSQESSQ
jgi:ParB/RepB/Spo0J family partition protein